GEIIMPAETLQSPHKNQTSQETTFMPQTLSTPAEFANALHEGRIAECLETIDALDAQLEDRSNETAKGPEPDSNAERASRSAKNQSKSESALALPMRSCSIFKHCPR